jgi:hypothetical protein
VNRCWPMWSSKESLRSPSCRQRLRVARYTGLARRTLRRGRSHGSARNQSRPLASFRLRSDGLPNSSRTTRKSETIDSSVGLVPTNALAFIDQAKLPDGRADPLPEVPGVPCGQRGNRSPRPSEFLVRPEQTSNPAFRQIGRFWNLRYAQDTFVKGTRLGLLAGWHRQLHMFDLSNLHGHLA